jgi:DNA gyrase subunit B
VLTSTSGTRRWPAVLDKVGVAARPASRPAHTELQRRKNALETSRCRPSSPTAAGRDDRSELFIVEGTRASGTAKSARDSEFQALLPIRGKILNVQKASASDMLKNAECASIIQVVGAGSGRTFDLSAARYGKIILMSDADVDGAHIRCLLLTLFYRYMRPLVEAGGSSPPCRRCTASRSWVGAARRTPTSTPTPTPSCASC